MERNHYDIRMTLAFRANATEGIKSAATAALEATFLDPAVDTPLSKGSGNTSGVLAFFRYLQDF